MQVDYFKAFQKLEETITELEVVSGYNMDELLNKFMAGWKLLPPEDPTPLKELDTLTQLAEEECESYYECSDCNHLRFDDDEKKYFCRRTYIEAYPESSACDKFENYD